MKIQKVTLNINELEKAKNFYVNRLGFKLIMESSDKFIIQVGSSELEFVRDRLGNKPFYHYAFTIAGNHFEEAKMLIQSKVELNTEDGEDAVYFESLDANSFYFHDPAGNVVEFIARKAYSAKKDSFSIEDVINISEINLTVNDVLGSGQKLIANGLEHLDDNPIGESALNFIGDKEAYFLLGPKGRTWFFSDQVSDIFPITVELEQLTVGVDEEGELIFS